MATFGAEQLRNFILLGHGGSGKTSLSEALLFDSGTTSRLGRIEDKNTVSDYDDEEHNRGLSVNLSVLPLAHQGCKLNMIDAPGYMDFTGEVKAGIRAADAGIMVVCASSGVEVGAELHWSYLDEAKLPRMIFVNKMDRDNASFERVIEQLNTKFDAHFVPVQLPIGERTTFKGVVDVLTGKAYIGPEGTEAAVPADIAEQVKAARTAMMEFAAETDDDLMLKYLDGEELTSDELRAGLIKGAKSGSLVLVFAGSATLNIGVKPLLDAVVGYLPSPAKVVRTAIDEGTGQLVDLTTNPADPLVVQVFKTLADPFVGKQSYYRVYSGTLTSDTRVFNVNTKEEERVGQLFTVRGKEQTSVEQVAAGDIGAVTKLAVTTTGHTLCDRGAPRSMAPIVYPDPLYSAAVFPKTKADLDKLSNSLARLVEEDPTLRVERDPETAETILSGMGESHIQIAAGRLARKFGVEIVTDVPTIPYRETITKIASAQGRHKKQTGGRGQFGDVYIRFEPMERGEGFEFTNEVFGGAVPKNFIPAVEKGMREIMSTGVLAGFPTVDFRAVIYDGSYHPVDSSEIAFKLAAHLAFKAGIPDAGPVLLEPIMEIIVTVPEEFTGAVLGDLNTRRARVQGMEQVRGNGVVTATVPLAEIQRYATDLRSMTQGRGIYTVKFVNYDIVPSHLVEKIASTVAEKRKAREG